MTEIQHTPGPWRLAKEPPNCGLTVTLYGFGTKTLGTIHTGSNEYMANARLIAAAPELLRFAKILAGEDSRFHVAVGSNPIVGDKMLSELRSAIAKAEGQANLGDDQHG